MSSSPVMTDSADPFVLFRSSCSAPIHASSCRDTRWNSRMDTT